VTNTPYVLNVKTDFGAVGDGTTDDTAAFQNARNAAAAGGGVVFVPPGQYRVGRINDTGGVGVVFEGSGLGSKLLADAQGGIWWDCSGSTDWKMRDIGIANYGTEAPDVLFAMLGTTASYCRRNGFERVTVDAQSNIAHAYLYGALRTRLVDCNWTQTKAGPSQSPTSDNLRSSVLRGDANNRFALTSAFASVLTGPQGVWWIETEGSDFIDANSNGTNAAVVLDCVGLSSFDGGSAKSSGIPMVWWSNEEAIELDGYIFLGPPDGGSAPKTNLKLGGGYCGDFEIASAFFSVVSGALITLGAPVNGVGGINRAFIGPCGIGGGSAPILGIDFTPTGGLQVPWLKEVEIDGQGLSVVAASDIDPSCKFRNVASCSVPAGCRNIRVDGNPGYEAQGDGSYEIFGMAGPIGPSAAINVAYPAELTTAAPGRTVLSLALAASAVMDGVGGGTWGSVSLTNVSATGVTVCNQSPSETVYGHWRVRAR